MAVTASVDSRASSRLAASIATTPTAASQVGTEPSRCPVNVSTATARLVPTKQLMAPYNSWPARRMIRLR